MTGADVEAGAEVETRADVETRAEPAAAPAAEAPWRRLAGRMIWVDALRVVLGLLPGVIALFVLGVEPNLGTLAPLAGLAAWGLGSAGADVLRWITTRYRVTGEYVERRTGLFVRTSRTMRRERVRSVDADARLLQRMAGLRRVTIGAGQVSTALEPALVLDAVSLRDARELRRELTSAAEEETDARVFARLEWSWIWYNLFGIWAYLAAAGVLWGGYWTAAMFGLDPAAWVGGLADWEALGWGWTIAIAVVAVGLLGVLAMAVSFCTEHAHFRLERVPGEEGTVLRTTQGLLKTREVNRDDRRLRGVAVSEPLLWRWMRMADTTTITTGLSVWSSANTILPRGPRRVAWRVAAAVLGEEPSPLQTPLRRHPRAALRRRLAWAALTTAGVAGPLWWLGRVTGLPGEVWWITALVLGPLALALAWCGYRALGHAVAGRYLVVRSGAVSRATSALRRSAVSGVRVRQSLLQRRLGLATVTAATAAGNGTYAALDLAAAEAVDLADAALPGVLAPFRAETASPGGAAAPASPPSAL